MNNNNNNNNNNYCCELVQRTGKPCQLKASAQNGRCGKHKRCHAQTAANSSKRQSRRCLRDINSPDSNYCWQHQQQLLAIRDRIMTTGGSDYAKLCLVMGDSTDAIQLREQLVDACAQFLLCKQFGITTDINTFTSTNITFNDETENQRQQQQRLRRKSGYIYAFSSAIDDSLVKIGMTTQQQPAKRIKQQVWASPDTLLYRYNPQTGVFPTRNCRLAESMIHFVLKQCRMHVDRPCSVFHGDRMAGYTEWFQSADWLQPLIRICCCSVAIALHQ